MQQQGCVRTAAGIIARISCFNQIGALAHWPHKAQPPHNTSLHVALQQDNTRPCNPHVAVELQAQTRQMLFFKVLFLAFLSATKCSSHSHINDVSSDTICIASGECYPAIFEATEEFRVVREGQTIPAGLHVKMNLETGLKEARLLSDTDRQDGDRSSDMALVPGEEVRNDPSNAAEASPKPYPPSKALHGSDLGNFNEALDVLGQSSICNQNTKDALDILEELVHELEFGLKLADAKKSKGLEMVLHLLQSQDATCRSKAALVLGSALRNNDNALAALTSDFPVTSQLLELLRFEEEAQVQSMLIYALSAIMPEKSSMHSFLFSDGHEVILKTYSKGSETLKGKIASFIEDHFAQISEPTSKITLQKGNSYEAHLSEAKALGKWCDRFQESLLGSLTSTSSQEKLLSSVSQIKRSNMDLCTSSDAFLNYLAKESRAHSGDTENVISGIAQSARSLFGNTKASRKHRAEFL